MPGIATVTPSSDGGRRFARDDHRAVVVAHAGAVRQQQIPIGEVGVGVERHGADLVLAFERRAIQRLDVRQHMLDLEIAGRDLAAGKAVEHEGVVGIRTVSDGDAHGNRRSYTGFDSEFGVGIRVRSRPSGFACSCASRADAVMTERDLVRRRSRLLLPSSSGRGRTGSSERQVVRTPSAFSTYDGSRLADVQAEPDDTATSLMPISSDSPSTSAKLMFRLCGSRCSIEPLMYSSSSAPVQPVVQAIAQRARARAASAAISACAISRGLAEADDPGHVQRAGAHAALVAAAVDAAATAAAAGCGAARRARRRPSGRTSCAR